MLTSVQEPKLTMKEIFDILGVFKHQSQTSVIIDKNRTFDTLSRTLSTLKKLTEKHPMRKKTD